MKTPEFTGPCVLIVDDSADTLSMLNDTLEQAGMNCLLALDAKQALSIAGRMLPDIILVDAIMPNTTGFDLCQQLKYERELHDIPVIFMTGLNDAESLVKAFSVGAADFITKPINTAELIARMRVHIANTRIRQSAQSALDQAGHYVFAVNKTGALLWSTPLVNQLLQQAGADDEWMNSQLPQQLKTWLARNPMQGNALVISAPEREFSLILLGHSGPGEILLRLMPNQGLDESQVLREHLQLTQREADVLLWISRGKTNREMAQILEISPRTINKHLEQVFKKLQVDNRTSAARVALEIFAQK
ncbi:MAG TPA: DNA-binding response regulator [Cellvibrionaceae bacterium]|nr:DNA-binding response regulator [Cellvibrionaceae bacterium]HMW47011.1 DNA-binding response regulator [Cellvibrionaceae bacterium]HMW72106.1 DNA-binding response regulator [Cellvibrionaceae bacterium]HMY38220.1 DNA-binding response regulator [Marinagarivorans sp.]HNG58527.1 DNA-binding response regulator [Cellvibrionaceae bacterium]